MATPENAADTSLTDLIEAGLFDKETNMVPKIDFIRAPKVFTTVNGLADKLRQFKGVGIVIARGHSFTGKQLETAIKTGIEFAVAYEDGYGEWKASYMGLTTMANLTKKEAAAA